MSNKRSLLQEIQLEWIVAGRVLENNKSNTLYFIAYCRTNGNGVNVKLENNISKFWHLKEVEKDYSNTKRVKVILIVL